MKIMVLFASPHSPSSTMILVDRFADGARDAGHEVNIVDVTEFDVAPCTGCIACGYEGDCVQGDAMTMLRADILASDMLVFATPLYYFGMSAQLKTAVDRFCAFNTSLTNKRMKSALLTVAWNSSPDTFDALVAHYQALVSYLQFEDAGMVLGFGCGSPSMTKATRHPEAAHELGRSL